MSGENYRSATKSHDPGWNDPPPIPIAHKARAAGTKAEQKQKEDDGAGNAKAPDRDVMITQVRTVFDEYVQRLEESRRANVQKRINLLYDQWTNRTLPEELEILVYNLSTALLDEDDVRANVLHRTIVCDHASKCAQWAPMLRQLIFTLQLRNERTKPIGADPIVQPL
uniref:SRA1/Sec31 domain-containing protein n=1 Tax=Anopheles epiroticus TaxID=199890 RepID=A0A182PT44_9DIPT